MTTNTTTGSRTDDDDDDDGMMDLHFNPAFPENGDAPPPVPIASPDAGASLPDYNPNASTRSSSLRSVYSENRRQNKRKWRWIAVGSVLLLALVIGLSVGLSKSNDESSSDSDSAQAPDAPRQATLEEVIDYLDNVGVSEVEDMQDISSPQGKAARWLAEIDGRNLPVPAETASSEEALKYVSRYVLAVLYSATEGRNWEFQFDFLSEKDICNWNEDLIGNDAITGEPIVISMGAFCDDDTHSILRILVLNQNNLSGRIPAEIGFLSSLSVLFLRGNELKYEIPPELCQLDNLIWLGLNDNELFGTLPSCISDMTNLAVLALSGNLFYKELPDLSKLSNLVALMLDNNAELEGDVTTMFNNMPSLNQFYVDDTSLTANVDKDFLSASKQLFQIDMSSCEFSGSFPSHLLDLTNLQVLDLHDNMFTGPLPSGLTSPSQLVILALQENNFNGTIPDAFLESLPVLGHLDLSNNEFTGAMPGSALAKLPRLRRLYLAGNPGFKRAGLPSEFAALTGLWELSVKNSNRASTIPTYLGNMTLLQLLDLDNNDFNGTIPSELGDLPDLQFLLLNRNERITGSIPSTFSQLTDLRVLFVDQTSLSGDSIEDVMCSLGIFSKTVESDADGTELLAADCGGDADEREVECSCCFQCCKDNDEAIECHDSNTVPSLKPEWQYLGTRVNYQFGSDNLTSFKSRQYLDLEEP